MVRSFPNENNKKSEVEYLRGLIDYAEDRINLLTSVEEKTSLSIRLVGVIRDTSQNNYWLTHISPGSALGSSNYVKMLEAMGRDGVFDLVGNRPEKRVLGAPLLHPKEVTFWGKDYAVTSYRNTAAIFELDPA